jgi:hypothetical protein
VLIDEAKRRQMPLEGLVKFFELSRFDNKLLEHFENKINGMVMLPGAKSSLIE